MSPSNLLLLLLVISSRATSRGIETRQLAPHCSALLAPRSLSRTRFSSLARVPFLIKYKRPPPITHTQRAKEKKTRLSSTFLLSITPPPAKAAMAQSPRLDSILSFSHAQPDQPTNEDHREDAEAASDSGDDDATVTGFEFAFAPPLSAGHSGGGGDLALADDLFAHGRILPAYPVFDRRHLLHNGGDTDMPASASTAPPSPDTYCPWVPRSAPGSPGRDPVFPKSASTGEARRWRLRDLVGAGGRSHSDGKEKFVFLQPAAAAQSKMSQGSKTTTTATAEEKQSEKSPPTPQHRQKQGQKKKKAVTEMDMATAHKLFYGKAGTTAGERKQQQASYLPYRPGILGFFANVHALGRSHHHPY